jgi:hypothetical protein
MAAGAPRAFFCVTQRGGRNGRWRFARLLLRDAKRRPEWPLALRAPVGAVAQPIFRR